jgi:hypothetical protein
VVGVVGIGVVRVGVVDVDVVGVNLAGVDAADIAVGVAAVCWGSWLKKSDTIGFLPYRIPVLLIITISRNHLFDFAVSRQHKFPCKPLLFCNWFVATAPSFLKLFHPISISQCIKSVLT